MKMRALTATVMLLFARSVFADPADVAIAFPPDGGTINTRNFTVQLLKSGDLEAARFDHIHYQFDGGANPTANDNSGLIDASVDRDGDHTLTVYLATPEHVVINHKVTVHFRVLTEGVAALAPANNSTLTSSDVSVQFTSYGNLPDGSRVTSSLDGAAEVPDSDGDGEFKLSAVSDGAHTVALKVRTAENEQRGDTVNIAFTVQSSLSTANAKKALASATRAAKSASGTIRKKELKKMKSIAAQMASGGDSNPASAALTHANVLKAQGYITKASKGGSSQTKYLKSLKSLFAKMAKS